MSEHNLIPQTFKNLEINLVEKDSEIWFTAESIGLALEYSDPQKAILKIFERNKEELEEYSTTLKLRVVDNKLRLTRVFTEEGVMIITMLSRQPKAREFRRWAVNVIKSYRHGHMVAMNPKAQRMFLIERTLNAASRISKNAGMTGNEAVLKAAELTENTIGVNIFTLLGINPPEAILDPNNYPEESKDFYEMMDLLLASGKIDDHGDKVDVIWIHMPSALDAIEQHLGRSFNRGFLFQQLKMTDRYGEQKNAKRSRIFKKPIRAWAFKRS